MSARALRTWMLSGIVVALSFSAVRKAEAAEAYPTCTKTPSDTDVVAAKGAFQAGQAAFNEADYSRAITYWEDAYRRDCTAHALLLNLSRAYELNGQLPEVVIALQTYNERTPNSEQREQNERRIEKILAEIQERDRAEASRAANKPSAVGTTSSAQRPSTPPAAPSNELDASTQPRRPLYPLYVAGGGAVLGIVGSVLWAGSRGTYLDYLADNCPTQDAQGDAICMAGAIGDRADELQSRTVLTGGLGLAGFAIAAGGVAWYFLQPAKAESGQLAGTRRSDQNQARLRVIPTLGPGAAGILVDGVL